MKSSDAPILVIPPRIYPEQSPVHDVWRRRNWPVYQVASLSNPDTIPSERAKLYGDYEFCVTVAHKLNLSLVTPVDDWLATVPADLANRAVKLIALSDVMAQAFPLFAKPIAPKLFRAKVYPTWQSLARETQGLVGETPIIVSEPVQFTCEVRCLVLNQEIVSVGCYEGSANLEDAMAFATQVIRHCEAPITCVVDVGTIQNRGWAVIEANAIWGSGLNGCDPVAMADCVNVATHLENNTRSI